MKFKVDLEESNQLIDLRMKEEMSSSSGVKGVKGDAELAFRTGYVNITQADIGLENVDNTADINKPISHAVAEALSYKQNTLTAGENIAIEDNVIRAIITPYDDSEIKQEIEELQLQLANVEEGLESLDEKKANVELVTNHTNDLEIHVTQQDKEYWNNKSEFDGDYNSLINQPYIPKDYDDSELREKIQRNVEAINEKQNIITDLDSIRSGARLGETALQDIPEEYITEEELESKHYLTQHQDLSHLATKVQVAADLATKQPLGNYALATDIPYVPTKVSEFLNDANYIDGNWVEAKGYLTEHQDISYLATKDEVAKKQPIGDYALKIDLPVNVSELYNDAGYITQELEPAFKNSVASSITLDDVVSWKNKQPAGDYAYKSDIRTKTSQLINDARFVNATELAAKQERLVSGTNIKTINNESLLGSGNITVSGGASVTGENGNLPIIQDNNLIDSGVTPIYYGDGVEVTDVSDYVTTATMEAALETKQDTLVSGASIKTINGNSILGSGNLVIQGGSGTITKEAIETALGYTPANINDGAVEANATWSSQLIAGKINDIEMAKFPNVTIFGQPTINNGQLSNFSSINYCQFPFVVDFQSRPFILDFEFTTGAEVHNQHNIFDSLFGLAFAVRNNKFVVAISTNGTSWNIGEAIGSHTITTNTTYRIRMEWNLSHFTLNYSLDGGTTYTEDINITLTSQPYPKQMFIGITSDKSTIFNGSINLNYASLTVADKVVWQGMDDVGLATRMAVNMNNIDEAGINKVKEIASEIMPTDAHINALIDAKLGEIENGSY